MNRAWGLAGGLSRRNFLALSASAAVSVVGLSGCKTDSQNKLKLQTRSQIGEDPADPTEVATIGSKSSIGNAEPIIVNGVGLVHNLPGTGSSPAPGGWRSTLEESLKRLKREQPISIKALLDDPAQTTSLVLVSAIIPPGARRGDPIDVQITLPGDSKTTSLQGGILFMCELMNSDTTGNVQAQLQGGAGAGPSGRTLLGNVWASAEGPLVAGNFVAEDGKPAKADTDADGRPLFRAGCVWGGGKVKLGRPYYLLLNPGDANPSVCAGVAERLNTTFHSTTDARLKVAEAKDRELVVVNVPSAYQHNHYRFLLVARQVPYTPVRPDSPYRRRLEEELMEPGTALTAAVKLEALGGDSRRSLRVGLESPSPWVRFAAAEALAYLGQTEGAGELARLAEDHPSLRAHCLTALASMNDAAATDRLVEMLANSNSEVRYGAFIALRLADKRHPALNGDFVGRSYWLHRVSPGSSAAVHLTPSGRNEVVLFGDAIKFRSPMPPLPVAGAFTVSVPAGETLARVTRVVKVKGDAEAKEVRCAADLASVLGAMAKLGGGYAEAVDLLRRADRAQVLTTRLVLDATPRELSIQQLSGFAKVDPTLTKANVEVARVGTVRPAVDANGFELPSVADAQITPAGAPLVKPPLNRDPGRIFGPKRVADAPLLDPAVVPASGQ